MVSRVDRWRSPYDTRSPAATRLHERHLGDAAAPPARGRRRSARSGAGGDAVEGDAAAHEVVAAGRVGDGGGGVGGVAHRHGDARRLDRRARAASKRSSCSAVNGSSGSSATAQCVHSDVERQRGLGVRRPRRARTTSSGAAPDAVHAGVDLEVDGHRRGPRRGRRARPRIDRPRVHGDAHAAASASSTSSGGGSDSSRIGASMPAAAQLGGLGAPARPPTRPRRPRAAARATGDGAVAVAVGLHHRAHLGRRATPRAASRRWRRSRRGTRRPRPRAISGRPPRARRAARRRGRRRRARRRGPAAPARAWSQAPAAAASSGRHAAGEEGADRCR